MRFEQAAKKLLELYYLLPDIDFTEVEQPKPRLVYRLSGDKGFVDAHESSSRWVHERTQHKRCE